MRIAIGSLAAVLLGVLPPATAGAQRVGASRAAERTLDIAEFEIRGSTALSQGELEAAVYPFLGPGRTLEDVEGARAALERAYSENGYQSVSVAIPRQTVRGGVVTLEVTEGRVGRLRVRGAHWFSPWDVRRYAPSLAEGTLPNFNRIVEDILVLNQIPDRKVTPALSAGAVPGTVDVDLVVEDRLPLHGSLELNNRHGRDTRPERVAGSLRYDNLFQVGHALTFDFQFAPQSNDQRALFYSRPYPDARVLSGSYLARIPGVTWFTLTASAIYQDSAVATASTTVEGTGRIAALKGVFTLPGASEVFQTVSLGLWYKEMGQMLRVGGQGLSAPITYWPVTAEYGANLSAPPNQAQVTLGLTASLRSLGSSPEQFDDRRYKASGAFILCRADLSYTRDLPVGLQAFGMVQGQYSPDPLIPSEQFSAGGDGTVRGYLTSEAVGDFGALGSLELRSPSLSRFLGEWVNEWRWHVFFDAARAWIRDPLPEQRANFQLRSVGVGTRLKLLGHLGGAADLALPLRSEGITVRYQPKVHFRVWTEF
jgi:hemolysin activation/secretion protein